MVRQALVRGLVLHATGADLEGWITDFALRAARLAPMSATEAERIAALGRWTFEVPGRGWLAVPVGLSPVAALRTGLPVQDGVRWPDLSRVAVRKREATG